MRKKTHITILSLLNEKYTEDEIGFTIDYVVMKKGKENVYSPNILPYFIGEALGKRPEMEKKMIEQARQEEFLKHKEAIESRMEELEKQAKEYRKKLSADELEEYKKQVHKELDAEKISMQYRITPVIYGKIDQAIMRELGTYDEYNELLKARRGK